MPEASGPVPSTTNQAWQGTPIIPDIWEAEAGGSKLQGQHGLHSELKLKKDSCNLCTWSCILCIIFQLFIISNIIQFYIISCDTVFHRKMTISLYMFSHSLAQHNNKRRLIRYYGKHLLTNWQPRRNKFIYNQQRLKHEVKENQNRSIMNIEVESAIKNFTHKKIWSGGLECRQSICTHNWKKKKNSQHENVQNQSVSLVNSTKC